MYINLVVFRLAGERCALPLSAVERIVRAVEVTPLPGAPSAVLGVIDVAGTLIPVFSLRRKFQLEDRDVGTDDQFVIAQTAQRRVAIVVDAALEVLAQAAARISDPPALLPNLVHVRGVARLDDGLVVIHNLEAFLTEEESRQLDEALDRAGG